MQKHLAYLAFIGKRTGRTSLRSDFTIKLPSAPGSSSIGNRSKAVNIEAVLSMAFCLGKRAITNASGLAHLTSTSSARASVIAWPRLPSLTVTPKIVGRSCRVHGLSNQEGDLHCLAQPGKLARAIE